MDHNTTCSPMEFPLCRTLSEHKQTTSHCTQPGLLYTAVQRVYGDNDEAVGMYDQHTIQCSYNRMEWFGSLTSSDLISGVEMYTLRQHVYRSVLISGCPDLRSTLPTSVWESTP